MGTFSNPELAKAIFYEYLRDDKPMSPVARESFANGFPSLLAPLAQVPGISVPSSTSSVEEQTIFKPYVPAMFEVLVHLANSMVPVMQNGMTQVASGTTAARRLASGSLNEASGEMVRHGGTLFIWFYSTSLESFDYSARKLRALSLKIGKTMNRHAVALNNRVNLTESQHELDPRVEVVSWNDQTSRGRGKILEPIAVEIEPTSSPHYQWLYEATVFLYLVLLLIASFPGPHSSRLVVKSSRTREENLCGQQRVLPVPVRTKERNEGDVDTGKQNQFRRKRGDDGKRGKKANVKTCVSYYL